MNKNQENKETVCKYCGSTDDTCLWDFDKNEEEAPCGAPSIEEDISWEFPRTSTPSMESKSILRTESTKKT